MYSYPPTTKIPDDYVWISPQFLKAHGWRPLDLVVLRALVVVVGGTNEGDEDANASTIAVLGRLYPHAACPPTQVRVTPELYDYVETCGRHGAAAAAAAAAATMEESTTTLSNSNVPRLVLAPLERIRLLQHGSSTITVTLERVNDTADISTDERVTLYVRCLHTDTEVPQDSDTFLWTRALAHRHIMSKTVVSLRHAYHDSSDTAHDDAWTLLQIDAVECSEGTPVPLSSAIRLPPHYEQIRLVVVLPGEVHDETVSDQDTIGTPVIDPAYPDLHTQLTHNVLSAHGPARPTGVLLRGPPGVGKTRLVQRAFDNAQPHQSSAHWISISQFAFQAWGQTATELAAAMMMTTNRRHTKPSLVILDDLHVLATNDENEISNDPERRVLQAAVGLVLDQCADNHLPLLALSTMEALPAEFLKAGRLEVTLTMEAPTLRQREIILTGMLQQMGCQTTATWAAALATTTAGCVAADLRQICIQAQTRARACAPDAPLIWTDFKEAAQSMVPSQLALLDVVKPTLSIDTTDWQAIHAESWRGFCGYAGVKKRVYRTVVLPWRRVYLSTTPADTALTGAIIPPSGVLFHGPSGCGKTVAAECLASSLGLPMIRVRAANVLDKWLGGSEATIRSLFARARSAAPCVLFFDEIDAIATNRSTDTDTVDVMSRVLSTLLNEMDGVSTDKTAPKVLVVACTNRLEALDAALLRPGRLDEHVGLYKLENVDDVEAVLRHYLARAPLDAALDLRHVAVGLVQSKALSGAEIEGLCRAAVLKAIRRATLNDSLNITSSDFNR